MPEPSVPTQENNEFFGQGQRDAGTKCVYILQ